MEQLEGHANLLQFLMYVVVIRVAIHGLVRELFRIEKAIDLRFLKCADIIIKMPFPSAMLNTSLTECLDMCLVDAIILLESLASRSSRMSFTLIFLAILLASFR